MAITQPAPSTLRPECLKHPGSRVRLDGFVPTKWSDAHRRPRSKRPNQGPRESVSGKFLGEFDDLMAEWDRDFNGDLDPTNLPAGSKVKVAWRCLLNEDHVWETRVAGRTFQQALCPFHMGNKVHPSESLAAYFPWLEKERHPTKNAFRPDQVTRASGREAHWICEVGHEWSAVVYSRMLSASGCPECFRLGSPAKSKAGVKAGVRRRRKATDQRAEVQIASLVADPVG